MVTNESLNYQIKTFEKAWTYYLSWKLIRKNTSERAPKKISTVNTEQII